MRRTLRSGFSLIEMIAVMVVLAIIGAVAIPALNSFYGNNRQKAAADIVRARMADARSRALRDGIPYRMAMSQDGTKVRVAPDGPDFETASPEPSSTPESKVTEDLLDKATAEVQDMGANPMDMSSAAWMTVATFQPDGTCREDNAVVNVREGSYPPIQIQLRGVTGATKTTSGGSGP